MRVNIEPKPLRSLIPFNYTTVTRAHWSDSVIAESGGVGRREKEVGGRKETAHVNK